MKLVLNDAHNAAASVMPFSHVMGLNERIGKKRRLRSKAVFQIKSEYNMN
jgi:hypothetical protein